jgi:hypothetical protein
MTKYTLHYGGDTFALPAEDAVDVREALRLAAGGTGMVLTLELVRKDGGVTSHHFLLTPGVQAYLTESDDLSSTQQEPSPIPTGSAGEQLA